MAKKSNKTEQVLKLITKEGEETALETAPTEPKVEIDVKPVKDQELKVEAKLKVEIEPEIEIKQPKEPAKEIKEKQAPADETKKTINNIHDQLCSEENRCLINLTEHMVKDKAAEIMEKLNVCTCPTCSLDVLALTLNSLPNKFITTDYGRLHLQLEIYKKQYETDVVSAITKACVRVKVSPRHEV